MASRVPNKSNNSETTPLLFNNNRSNNNNNNIVSNSSPPFLPNQNYNNNNDNNNLSRHNDPALYYNNDTTTYQDHPFNLNKRQLTSRQFCKFLLIVIFFLCILSYFNNPKKIFGKEPPFSPPPPIVGDTNFTKYQLNWKGDKSFDYWLESSNPIIFDTKYNDNSNTNSRSISRTDIIGETRILNNHLSSSSEGKRKKRNKKIIEEKLRKNVIEHNQILNDDDDDDDEGVGLYCNIFIYFYQSFKVLVANSIIDGRWTNSNITFITYENKNNIATEISEFKINWTPDLEGTILKRKSNFKENNNNNNSKTMMNNSSNFDNSFDVVAYVKGSIDHGFMFYENFDESGKLFVKTNQTVSGWKLKNQRNIYVYDESPIPAIIPALYIIYYDFFQRMSL